MIFFLNADGNTTIVKNQAINQGSIDANSLIIVAPFSRTNVVSASFILPNGLVVEGGIAVPLADLGTTPLKDNNGNIYNAWGLDLDFPATQYSGTVKVQFSISLGSGKTLKSYTTQFEVSKGIIENIPDFDELNDPEEFYGEIKNYIASINESVVEASDKAISYARYMTDEEYLINKEDANISLSVVPDGATYKGTFTVPGMTEYLTEEQIVNPTLDTNADDLFFQLQTNVGVNQGGFVIDLGSVKDVGIVQMYAWSIWQNLTMKAYVKGDEGDYTLADTVTFPATVSSNVLDIFRFNINQNARYIKIVQEDANYTNGSYACKGIEIFEVNVKGYYRIVQNNGNVIELDTFNAQKLIDEINDIKTETISEINDIKTETQGYATDAENALTQLTSKAGQVGGYPVLQDIDGSPKIPSVYINQVDVHNQVEITSESQLETVDVQPGDVAYLVETVSGVKTVTKSWILLSIENGTRNWAVYGTSYATNSGNAAFAQSAANAQQVNGVTYNKVTQAQYDALVDKTGVYFVVLGE